MKKQCRHNRSDKIPRRFSRFILLFGCRRKNALPAFESDFLSPV
jgi:hypothetical protein